MKARRVKKLHPDAPLADNAERIVRVRLDELVSFVPAALDPAEVVALHDMRIAAKRLRYLLEVTSFCFGPYAAIAVRRAKALQDLLGEIHDCDVMLPRVAEHLDELRAADVANLRRLADDAEDLDPALTRQAPNRAAYRGLEVLEVHLRARRELLFERFLGLWRSYERQAFRARLEWALGERPVEEPPPEEPAADGLPPDAQPPGADPPDDAAVAVEDGVEGRPPPAVLNVLLAGTTTLGVPPSPGDDPAATMAAAMDVAAVAGADAPPDEDGGPEPNAAGGTR